eukprot:12193453-Alexandrium_andersonii.AAC.1
MTNAELSVPEAPMAALVGGIRLANTPPKAYAAPAPEHAQTTLEPLFKNFVTSRSSSRASNAQKSSQAS